VWEQSEKEEGTQEDVFGSLAGHEKRFTGAGSAASGLTFDNRWSSSDCEVPQSVKMLWSNQAPEQATLKSMSSQPHPFSRASFGQSGSLSLQERQYSSKDNANTSQAPKNNSILSSFMVNKIE